jgi:hypothetical protein
LETFIVWKSCCVPLDVEEENIQCGPWSLIQYGLRLTIDSLLGFSFYLWF